MNDRSLFCELPSLIFDSELKSEQERRPEEKIENTQEQHNQIDLNRCQLDKRLDVGRLSTTRACRFDSFEYFPLNSFSFGVF